MNKKENIPDIFILEREGSLYDGSIKNVGNSRYTLDIDPKNYKPGLIKHTDIFTWAIYMEGATRKISLNKKNKLIEKCSFSKGFTILSAILDSYK